MSLAELELSVRATNCLETEGITTVRELVLRSPDELLEVRNFGETTLREVECQAQGARPRPRDADSTAPHLARTPGVRGQETGVSKDIRSVPDIPHDPWHGVGFLSDSCFLSPDPWSSHAPP